MHFNFNFSASQILWTLTFAGLLVLLVVLLGRDRARRYPWFTAAMAMMALRMVTNRLLGGRLPQITFGEVFLALSDLASIISIGVVVEIARRAFKGAGRVAWLVWTLVLLTVGGIVIAEWGPWPAFKTLFAGSELSALGMMQLFAQKTDLLADILIIQLALLVVLFGRRYHAGFRSHTQQIVIGLSTASIAQTIIRIMMQQIGMHTTIHSQSDYLRFMDLQEKVYNANNVIYLAALVWWIVCLWIDEPGTPAAVGTTAEIPAITEESAPETGEVSSEPGSSAESAAKITEN